MFDTQQQSMKRRFTGITDTGLVRAVNQDNYYTDPEGRFFIVADGMGGHAGGQEASKIATTAIRSYLEQRWDSASESSALLEEAIERANKEIVEDQNQHPERAEMGTTAVITMFRQEQSWCAHVGDSRLYRLRGSQLEVLTEDHTWVAWALKAGAITPEEASLHPWRHVLAHCLGRQELQKIDLQSLEVGANDRLLLCSDGLNGELSDEEIRSYLQSSSTCEQAAKALVDAAKEQGGSDNITVVVIEQD